jgi:prostaglandin-H2 D-isomerase / glutathione transferase
MTTYRLTYFDLDGGRGEPVRIAFHAAGIEFEDNRISFDEFREMRQGTPFHCVPVLEIDGAVVTQSNAMSRYVGKMAGLYPDDNLQALYADEAMGAVEDVTHRIVGTFGLEGETLRQARENLVEKWLSVFLRGLNEMLTRGGGEYLAGNSLSVADLKVAGLTAWLGSGELDHVPKDLVPSLAPAVVEHQKRIERDARVVAYYAARS